MGFFKRDKDLDESVSRYGRLYVIRFTLSDGTILHKVGMVKSPRSVDRMMEILRSFFMTYRYIPQCELRKDKKVVAPLLIEQHMHELLEDYSYKFNKQFDGYTEFFYDLDECILLDHLDNLDYRDVLEAKGSSMNKEDYDAISDELKRTVYKDSQPQEGDKLPF